MFDAIRRWECNFCTIFLLSSDDFILERLRSNLLSLYSCPNCQRSKTYRALTMFSTGLDCWKQYKSTVSTCLPKPTLNSSYCLFLMWMLVLQIVILLLLSTPLLHYLTSSFWFTFLTTTPFLFITDSCGPTLYDILTPTCWFCSRVLALWFIYRSGLPLIVERVYQYPSTGLKRIYGFSACTIIAFTVVAPHLLCTLDFWYSSIYYLVY